MLLSSVIAEIANKPVLLVASSPVHVDNFLLLSVYSINVAAGKCELLKKHKVLVLFKKIIRTKHLNRTKKFMNIF